MYRNYHRSSALWKDRDQLEKMTDSVEKTRVSAVSLDEFIKPKTRIDVLKIDAEGAKSHILKGARRILTENAKIKVMMEWFLERFHAARVDVAETCSLIRDAGFSASWIGHHGKLLPCEISDLDEGKSTDSLKLCFIESNSSLSVAVIR